MHRDFRAKLDTGALAARLRPLDYAPVKAGLRFSMKARRPSR
jgi:hypothetical protein